MNIKPLRIIDATQITNKPGGGHSWQGCLTGCTKAVMLKPNTTARDEIDTSGIALIHVEVGKDAEVRTKKERASTLALIGRIAALADSKKPGIRKVWYAPRACRAEFHAFMLGDNRQAKAVNAWDAENAALVEAGFPGVGEVFVDLYTFESIHASLAARATHAMIQWTGRKVKALPIGCLRYQDTGRVMTLAEARAYIGVLHRLSPTGEVAIFDLKHDGTPDDYGTSPVARMIETFAKEGL